MECINATSLRRKSGKWGTQLGWGLSETAVPSLRYAPVGMTKWRTVTFIKSRQIGWTERNCRSYGVLLED
jgi:hypothetical protein